jgi:anti-sigma B factor antagonist
MFTHTRLGAVDIIRGSDPINLPNAKQLSNLLDGCLVTGQPRVVIDLEKVSLIDSAGLELLLDYQDRCVARGGVMKLSTLTPLCRDILTVTDVIARFEVHQDSLSAVGSFSQ